MLYFIGLGLTDEKDITVKGLEAIKKANKVFLEGYTSTLQVEKKTLEKFYNKKITLLSRKDVEQEAQKILEIAKKETVAFLVIGDVFAATTHTDLYQRAQQEGIKVNIIHNTSIINAISNTGLDLYKFGRTTTIVYPEKNYSPTSFYDVIQENRERGLHTLCLLDIKADEKRYMTIPEAIRILETIQKNTLTEGIGCARITAPDEKIVYGTFKKLKEIIWGEPPHCLIIPGKLHVIEEELLEQWKK